MLQQTHHNAVSSKLMCQSSEHRTLSATLLLVLLTYLDISFKQAQMVWTCGTKRW